jgi:hypothetical protein
MPVASSRLETGFRIMVILVFGTKPQFGGNRRANVVV